MSQPCDPKTRISSGIGGMTSSVGWSWPATGRPHSTNASSSPAGADRCEHASTLGADDVRVRDPARRKRVVVGAEVDPLAADENRDLAVENVERLVVVVVDVHRSRGTARVVGDELGEATAGLVGAGLDGQAAGLPPDVGKALICGDAVRLGERLRGSWRGSFAVSDRCPATVGALCRRVS